MNDAKCQQCQKDTPFQGPNLGAVVHVKHEISPETLAKLEQGGHAIFAAYGLIVGLIVGLILTRAKG